MDMQTCVPMKVAIRLLLTEDLGLCLHEQSLFLYLLSLFLLF